MKATRLRRRSIARASERLGVVPRCDRIEITALDVLGALIDATYTKERTQHLRRANLGIEKLRFLLRLALLDGTTHRGLSP